MSVSDDSWSDDSSSTSDNFIDSDFSDSVSLKYGPTRQKRNVVKKKYLQFKRANADNDTSGVATAVPEESNTSFTQERAKLLNEKRDLLDAPRDAEDAQPSKMANKNTPYSSSTIPTVIVEDETLSFESSHASGSASLSAFHGTEITTNRQTASGSFLTVPEFESTYGLTAKFSRGSCDIANSRATREVKPSQQRKRVIEVHATNQCEPVLEPAEDTGLTQNNDNNKKRIVGQSSNETKHVETMPEQAKNNDGNDTAINRQN